MCWLCGNMCLLANKLVHVVHVHNRDLGNCGPVSCVPDMEAVIEENPAVPGIWSLVEVAPTLGRPESLAHLRPIHRWMQAVR